MSKLTPKQKAFADYYIELGNVTEAAKKAGYKQPHVQGSQNLEKLSIKQYIEERMKELDSERIASQEEILIFLTQVLRGEVDEEFALGVGKGAQILERKTLEGKDRLKAAELLGKRFLMWNNKESFDIEKVKADTEFVKERTKLLKGAAKDTSLMEALISVVKDND